MEPLSIATPNYLDRLRTEMYPTVKKKYPCHNSLYLTPAWCRLNIEKKHVWRRRRRRRRWTSCIMRSSPLFSHRQEYALGRESASPVSRGGVQLKKKQLEFYRNAIARTLMIMMVVVVGNNHDEYQLLWLISSSTNLTMMRMIARHARRLKLLIGLCLCESPTTIGGTSELWRCSQLLFSIINSKLKIVFFKTIASGQLLNCLDNLCDEWKTSRLLK